MISNSTRSLTRKSFESRTGRRKRKPFSPRIQKATRITRPVSDSLESLRSMIKRGKLGIFKAGSILTKGLVVVFLTFLVHPTVWAGIHSTKKTTTFTLGNLKLGERLRYFKARFPGAACGTANVLFPINRHTLDDPDDAEYLSCCIDDSESLAKFSKFKILTLEDQCHVLVHFWKERLVSLRFVLDVPSIEQLLPSFEGLYGPAHQKIKSSDQDHQLDLVSWWDGVAVLELETGNWGRKIGPDHLPPGDGMQKTRLVQVDLWDVTVEPT